MSDRQRLDEPETEQESFPLEPRYHPIHKVPRAVYDFLASAKLALFLLVAILLCCLAGATFLRGPRAWELIFSSLWFNGLLVLLIINVACCFFGRIWGRRVTLISLGMILFHLSFVTMFAGIIYNGLFYFRGVIRLTEGEVLPSWSPESYDSAEHGRYFNWKLLKGTTKLIKMQYGFKVDGDERRVAYEIETGDGAAAKRGWLYILQPFEYRGFKYFREKEGYSVLTLLHDRTGKELYGAHLALQSHLVDKDKKTYRYTTGTKDEPAFLPFPQPPGQPLFNLNVTYQPDLTKAKRDLAHFQLRPLQSGSTADNDKILASGQAAIGEKFTAGDYALMVKEVRYWAAMSVRYEPGQPIILASLWVGLAGMILTTGARMFRKRR